MYYFFIFTFIFIFFVLDFNLKNRDFFDFLIFLSFEKNRESGGLKPVKTNGKKERKK